MGLIKWIKSFFKKIELGYPNDFAIIDYSPVASENGIKTNRNKVISRFSKNSFGNIELKKYRYSEERVKSLQDIYKIPVYDKTKKDLRFPVFSRILPSEIRFIQNR